MFSVKKLQEIMGILLLIGISLSASLVCIGGLLFLWQHGGESIQTEWMQLSTAPINRSSIWQLAFSFTPLGMIELGLLLLVFTQIIRVALLCGFYAVIKDYWFTFISTFILCVLVYSFFWR